MHMTPVYALFPVSSTGNGMSYEVWSSKSDAFTSLATAGGTSAGIGSSIELLRSTAAQCPETSAVVISSTPAWCDCCVCINFHTLYLFEFAGENERGRARGRGLALASTVGWEELCAFRGVGGDPTGPWPCRWHARITQRRRVGELDPEN